MLKKFFMVIGALAVIGIIAAVGISYYVNGKIDTAIKEREPEFRQYVTMTVEEQNAYVEKTLGNLTAYFINFGNDETNSDEIIAEIKKNPELFDATITYGRAVVAGFILNDENITKDLNAEVLKQLKAEYYELKARQNKFHELADQVKSETK